MMQCGIGHTLHQFCSRFEFAFMRYATEAGVQNIAAAACIDPSSSSKSFTRNTPISISAGFLGNMINLGFADSGSAGICGKAEALKQSKALAKRGQLSFFSPLAA